MKHVIKQYHARSLEDLEGQTIFIKLENMTVVSYSFVAPKKKDQSQ